MAAAGRGGRPPCPPRPGLARRPAAAGGAGAASPRRGPPHPRAPRPGQACPQLPSPAKANHAPVRGETPPGGLCGRARGRLLVLSSPGWARPGLRGGGAAAGPGLGCSSCGSAGVSAAAASAGMCLGRCSWKCGARTASLQPLSGGGRRRRRRRARSLFLWLPRSHALPAPSFSSPARALRRPRPSWQGAPTAAAPGVLPLPAPRVTAATSVRLACTSPQTSPVPREWLCGRRGRWDGGWGRRERAREGPGLSREKCETER